MIAALGLSACHHQKETYSNYVDPFIGTGAHGHTYPGAQLPFGMVQLSPDTRNDGSWDGCGGYHYSDKTILGFSHTHLSGVGVSDYGDILIMPITGKETLHAGTIDHAEGTYRSNFRHETEIAKPGYYSVELDDYQIKAELTSTTRVGFHKYTALEDVELKLLIDLIHRDPVIESEIHVIDNNKIEGYRHSKYWAGEQKQYFAMTIDRSNEGATIYKNAKSQNNQTKVQGEALQSILNYTLKKGESIEIKVALSPTSCSGAWKNMEAEAKNIDFNAAKKDAAAIWEKELSKIEVDGGTLKERRNFYTGLYHSLLTPNISEDVDGSYLGMDGKIHQSEGFTNYTIFSLWDTFRSLHPLLTIIDEARTNDFVKALVHKSEQFGELPMWELASNDTRCMIGYHAVSLIADAHVKGISDYDLEQSYEQMKRTAMLNKRGLRDYKRLGFVPSNKSSQAVSKTLEYAYNDYCVAVVAKSLNKMDDYKYFMGRAISYRNIYNPATGFMQGKTDEHRWVEDFDATKVGYNYTEGNSFQYSLFVPHDLGGLTELMGGKTHLDQWLDSLFNTQMPYELDKDTDVTGLIGQYAHGNEPSHHMAYLYTNAGTPWKTQKIVRQIIDEQYLDTPGGLCGNEDCGQMSAWYVMSAMGFYSVCPGIPEYTIGSPIFDEVRINHENGNTLTIKTINNSANACYIQSAKLNGKSFDSTTLQHESIVTGGELIFEMGDTPCHTWGVNSKVPKSIFQQSELPYLTESEDLFLNAFIVDIRCDDPNAMIIYTTDGDEPVIEKGKEYSKPFTITASTQLKMRTYAEGLLPGYVVTRNIRKSEATVISKRGLQPGIRYNYYEGIYRSAYDFKDDEAVQTGVVPAPTLDVAVRNEWIGIAYDGYINIPEDGAYTFYVDSNDGCQLLIDGEEQFESDGRKTVSFEQEACIQLAKGLHKFELKFFQCSDRINLTTEWSSKKIKRQTIQSSYFYTKR